MTSSSQQPVPPVVPAADRDDRAGETAGDSDRDRDREDGTPVGRDELRADVERSGGDPDSV
jgi:hypothetical protein